jgi:hypothetical protein
VPVVAAATVAAGAASGPLRAASTGMQFQYYTQSTLQRLSGGHHTPDAALAGPVAQAGTGIEPSTARLATASMAGPASPGSAAVAPGAAAVAGPAAAVVMGVKQAARTVRSAAQGAVSDRPEPGDSK